MNGKKTYDLTYISLGAGVQSSVMALMAARGELKPMPAFAIFADTQDEPIAVYEWLKWLEKQLPFPVYKVTKDKLSTYALQVIRSKKSGKLYSKNGIPVFTKNGGMLRRTCTSRFKIEPIWQFVRTKVPKGGIAEQWIGISTDEAHRMKDSIKSWIVHRWPLIDTGMSRHDCLEWAKKNGIAEPPRSACVYCPYHSDVEWLRIRDNDPDAWSQAVQFEGELRQAYAHQEALNEKDVYFHRQCVPLSEVKFGVDLQMELDGFGNECEGMCGV